MKQKRKYLLIALAAVLLIGLAFIAYYLTSYSESLVTIEDYQKLDPNVTVQAESDGILIDSINSDSVMVVFYPGAKIEPIAYIPLLYKLGQHGIDSFIVEMPFNLAIFDQDAFNSVYDKYNEQSWYIMGHSLGGSMAANFAADNSSKLSGIILLAAYSTKDLKGTHLPILSIYGSNDGVLNKNKYEENKVNFSDDTTEYIINGGNHAGFGDYGIQKGDGEATISNEEQQQETVDEIIKFIDRTKK